MMTGNVVAWTYALLAFERATAGRKLERWREDLASVSRVNPADVVAHCKQMQGDRRKPLEGILAQCLPEVADFVCLIVSRGLVHLLADIASSYDHVLDEHYGLTPVDVVTAVPLDEKTLRAIEQRLSAMANRRFVVNARVDPDIVGGLIVKVGDKVIDRSVKAKLDSLRQDILESLVERQSNATECTGPAGSGGLLRHE
ncbi:MAG TPA: ATP synthase F1 subunit delta [Dehalococcoidia bacterium]|nr:ATP synthase F1 subunit delta [Dehalococcoidia bacterium]